MMATKNKIYAKIVLLTLESKEDVVIEEDLEKIREEMESHIGTEVIKAVDALRKINATESSKDRGAAEDGNFFP